MSYPRAHNRQGESRSLLQHVSREGIAPVLHGLQFVNRSRLALGIAHELHRHDDHEEVFYMIGDTGAVLLGGERRPIREGDATYIAVGTLHGLIDNSAGWLDFLAIGGSSLQRQETFSER